MKRTIPIVGYGEARRTLLERLLDLPADIAYYISSDPHQGGERLMPIAAGIICALAVVIAGAQIVLWLGRAH